MLNKQKKISGRISAILGIVITTSLLSLPAIALDSDQKSKIFSHSPRLVGTEATYHNPSVSSTYSFTISVPENAGQALKAVTITQKPNFEQIQFTVNESRAFVSNHFKDGEKVALSSIGGQSQDGQVTIVFDEPIQPGHQVTIDLKAKENPQHGGIYLFGIRGFSEGMNHQGLYLGTARLHFSSGD